MRLLGLFIALSLCALSAIAGDDAARQHVQDVRPLMIAAIDSTAGEARGILDGDAAQAIGRHFHSTAPILVDISTERRFGQAGCSRLKVAFRQDGVVLPGAVSGSRQGVVFGVDYCRDGTAPRSLQ
jgi:hypothetical protein